MNDLDAFLDEDTPIPTRKASLSIKFDGILLISTQGGTT